MTKQHNNSTQVSKGPCPDCTSSDALVTYDDGHTHCFSCNKTTQSSGTSTTVTPAVEVPLKASDPKPIEVRNVGVPSRNLSSSTVTKYGVAVYEGQGNNEAAYPYYDAEGNHVATKTRTKDKKFFWSGDRKTFNESGQLFGQNLFPANSAKAITIVEGEYDALAAYQMQGSKYPCVSVTSASMAPTDVIRNYGYLNSFSEIVIAFDTDEAKVNPRTGEKFYPGQDAALAVAKLFEIGKVRIVTLAAHKDPCDYLKNGDSAAFMKEWWSAPSFTPTGLVKASDMWDKIKAPKVNESISYPYALLNDKTYGIRLSEMVTLTADTGVGKTSIFKEIEHHILTSGETEHGLGLLHLEEPNDDTALGLLSITANKPLHLPDTREQVSEEELRGYFDKTLNNDRVVMWDHFGSNTIDEVIANIRYMVVMGCRYIFLDHLSILVSDQSGDERKQLDEAATKLKTLSMELDIALIQVIHQNRAGEIRGTAGVEQLSNIVIKFARDKKNPDEFMRNTMSVMVEKNRFCGRTGPAGFLHYESHTGRLRELDEKETARAEQGQAPEDFVYKSNAASVAPAETWKEEA